MDASEYYVTTLISAFKNLAPVAAFIIGGYFVFIKMPFLFLKKSMDDQKKKMEGDSKVALEDKKYSLEDYQAFKSRMKVLSADTKKEEKKQEEKKKTAPPREKKVYGPSPEEVLGFKKDESISKEELKKRYFELLKQNHPDRVASMGPDFKKLAEKNTKDLNQAYETLKKKKAA